MSYPPSPMRIHWVNKFLHYTSYECSYAGSLFFTLYILYVFTWNVHLFLNLNLPMCFISSRVDVPFYLTSSIKCLVIVSSYTILTSPFEELHVSIWNACISPTRFIVSYKFLSVTTLTLHLFLMTLLLLKYFIHISTSLVYNPKAKKCYEYQKNNLKD